MKTPRKIQKLLAANRGEIAIRIFRAANELGLRTVGIYSQEDRLSLHRFKADESYQIGEGKGPVEAYLDTAGIIELALQKKVDAIHPGYGFLSENPDFARACTDAGITFIGPTPELLELLGDKTSARRLATAAGVPVLPGTENAVSSEEAGDVARKIGFPLIIKAAMGGGGRGMRVVLEESQLEARLEEASGEALSTFGDGSVFLEKYLPRARHLEVQILGDEHGNVLHLWERDCSVQRRHQKIVEVAPAANLAPAIRSTLCEFAVRIARQANYRNAGTCEFLLDVDSGNLYFIEVNPRVQVEHTVTEVVTGIDIVRSQILIAAGHSLHEAPLSLPRQQDLPLYGAALQCRVTTEDPENNFAPDYGKLTTYRSPAGFGIRLDGGSAYAGSSLVPYYDSLLVKVTAWDVTFPGACRRMDRALREFRVRGVKTNIPFLENVVNHPRFEAGEVTTAFLDQSPELFRFVARSDRATKLLSYLGDVILNGNPEVKGKRPPQLIQAPVVPRAPASGSPPAGTRQLLQKLGPRKFAQWARRQKQLLITDTTFRDAHQSLLATRVRTHDLLAPSDAIAHRLPNLFSMEMWGGATFDTAMRFLHEDPWQRLRELREKIPNICFQMLLRGANAVGYTSYPDNVIIEFVREAFAQGIDIFRIFDSLNSIDNMRVAIDAVLEAGGVCEPAICYTGDLLDGKRPKYSLKYYVQLAKQLEKLGIHFLAIKDMAGLCKPYAAFELVKALREEVGVPIHFHTHDTSGVNAASILMAAEAGADVADAAIASMSGETSQPNLNSLVESLRNTPRETGLDIAALNECADYWEVVRTFYEPFDYGPRTGSARVYQHEIPGGQFTNLVEQAASMGLGHRLREVESTYAEVNRLFGDIVKVTPSSKVVGDMTLFLLSREMKPQDILKLGIHYDVSLPNSVVEMFRGALGVPPGGWPKNLQRIILRGEKPAHGRPSAMLEPADFKAEKQALEKKVGRPVANDELLSALLYPEVFAKYSALRKAYGDVGVLPTPAFFYGLRANEEIAVEIEPGKTLIIRLLTVGDANPDGSRTLFFELNGQPREIRVRDESLKVVARAHPKADPMNPGDVAAPTSGVVTGITVQVNQAVQYGEKLLTLEAMKMQSNIYAPIAGRVAKIVVTANQKVEAKDLLLTIVS